MEHRACAECQRVLPLSSFTNSQLNKGMYNSRCIGCVHGDYSDDPDDTELDNTGDRACAQCQRVLPRPSFTSTQLNKGIYYSRCISCVHGHPSDGPAHAELNDMGRYNDSTSCFFLAGAIDNPIAEGTFRVVARGTYASGERKDQPCVGKWYKWGVEVDDDLFEEDLCAVDKAQDIINRFNQLNIADKRVKINIPDVWDLRDQVAIKIADPTQYRRPILVEPFIQNYRKWNSNSGWFDDGTVWGQVMQALSHFSYHITGGGYVLCDLQGGVYRREVILSDPVILSQFEGEYGATDMGADGITSFFSQHRCNQFCRPNWVYPAAAAEYYAPVQGTMMLRRFVDTQRAAPATARYPGQTTRRNDHAGAGRRAGGGSGGTSEDSSMSDPCPLM